MSEHCNWQRYEQEFDISFVFMTHAVY